MSTQIQGRKVLHLIFKQLMSVILTAPLCSTSDGSEFSFLETSDLISSGTTKREILLPQAGKHHLE